MTKHHHGHGGGKGSAVEADDGWHLRLQLDGDGTQRTALVELTVGRAVYEAHGRAPSSSGSLVVSDDLAVAQALSGLSHQLVEDAARRILQAEEELVDLADVAGVVISEPI